jgi:type IV secretory pathway protease TraF
MTRRAIFLAAMVGCAALVMPVLVRPQPWLIWNASASAPIGLYLAG